MATRQKSFSFGEADTCKHTWVFDLSGEGEDTTIEYVSITGRQDKEGREQGCLGHPRTIEILLRGARLIEVDLDALATAVCARKLSCAQALIQCLQQLRQEETGNQG